MGGGGRITYVDKLDVGKLLRERRQELVHELTVAQDHLLNPTRLDEVLDVARKVVRAEEGREDVHVVRPLHHERTQFDPLRILVERANDRDAVPRLRKDLNHVQCANVRTADV